MAGGRHYSSLGLNPRIRSPILLFVISFLLISLIFYIFSHISFPSSSLGFPENPIHNSQFSSLNPNADYSFVSSLEKFLASSSKYQRSREDTVSAVSAEDVKKLDDSIWRRETERLYHDSFHPAFSPLVSSATRVYVYDMPPKFTYDMLWLFRNTYKETYNLTSNGSPVHRLIEQHSIDYWLWADLIAPESERLLKNVVRVYRQEDADLFYIPFFTTISYFLLEKQQCKSLYRVKL